MRAYGIPLAALLMVALWGCSDDDVDLQADSAPVAKDAGTTPDKKAKPDAALTHLKVAAVQYGATDYSTVKGCSDDICGLSYHIRAAAKAKARLVVTPEYFQKQKYAEMSPSVGDKPGSDSRWKQGSAVKTFSALADQLNITLVYNLITQVGSGSSAKLYNTAVAVGPDGKVVARHYKFQLFGSESKQLTVGDSIKSSFFQTPAGRAGLLICADAQCVVTNMSVSVDCTSHSVSMLKSYFATKPRLVLFSSFWTVGSSNPTWWSLKIQEKLARQGKVWLVVANTTKGAGSGGGIYDPTGKVIKQVDKSAPVILYADIPLK